MSRNNLSVIVLAAGLGTRMKSDLPKVLHKFDGVPIIIRVLKTALALKPLKTVVVVGHKGEMVQQAVSAWNEKEGSGNKIKFVLQKLLKGSGRAVIEALAAEPVSGAVMILSGDVPLLSPATLKAMGRKFFSSNSDCLVLSCEVQDAKSYGRIIRNSGGGFEAIVEACDASPAELKIKEINSGVYIFKASALKKALSSLRPQGPKKEYYLTDCISAIASSGGKTSLYRISDEIEITGVNSKKELSDLYLAANRRKISSLYDSGVNVIDPSSVYISSEAVIGADTVIFPGVFIRGKSRIGRGCVIGPYCLIEDCEIDDGCEIKPFSCLYSSRAETGVSVGPFSHLRPETLLREKAKVGNFSEIKKSVIGRGSKVPHLSYVGDTEMGEKVNVGAGSITCNYDGVRKNKTFIGDGAFIGSNTNLVAPVKVGKKALIAAGSTITEDVPDKALALARARQVVKTKRFK